MNEAKAIVGTGMREFTIGVRTPCVHGKTVVMARSAWEALERAAQGDLGFFVDGIPGWIPEGKVDHVWLDDEDEAEPEADELTAVELVTMANGGMVSAQPF